MRKRRSRKRRSRTRRWRKGPLFTAVAIPVLFALLGGALVGSSGVAWFAGLVKPWFLVPLWAFYLVGLVYYVGDATILYRVRVHVADRRGRAVSLALIIGVLFCNELWNYLFFGLRSPLAGFLGIVVFLVPLTALLVTLRLHERFSAKLVVADYAWMLYQECPPGSVTLLEEVEEAGMPGRLEVLRKEGTDGVRYALWNATGWHRDYSPPAWRSRATEEQKRIGWEMAVRIEKIIVTVLDEAHKRQVEEIMDTLQEGPEGLYKRPPY